MKIASIFLYAIEEIQNVISHLYAPVYIGYYSGIYGGETAEQNLENHHCFGKSQYIDYLYIHLCFLGPKDLCERVCSSVTNSQIHRFTLKLNDVFLLYLYHPK